MGNWTLVFSAGTPHEAEMMRVMLEENGIPAVVMDRGSSVYPQLADPGVYVEPEHAVRAIHLLRNEGKA